MRYWHAAMLWPIKDLFMQRLLLSLALDPLTLRVRTVEAPLLGGTMIQGNTFLGKGGRASYATDSPTLVLDKL